MKVYSSGYEVANYPLIKRGYYLDGLNLEHGQIQPIYRPVVEIWRSPGMLHIHINNRMVNLCLRRPFVWVERSDKVESEDW